MSQLVAVDGFCEAASGCDVAVVNPCSAVLAGSCCFLHRQRGEFGFAFGDGVFKLRGAFGPLFWREGF